MRVAWWNQLAVLAEQQAIAEGRTLIDLREWRFVESLDWQPPPEFAYLNWFVLDPESDELVKIDGKLATERVAYEHFRKLLVPFETGRERDGVKWPNVAWYREGKPFYVADVSFDPVKRPVLVCIGGIR